MDLLLLPAVLLRRIFVVVQRPLHMPFQRLDKLSALLLCDRFAVDDLQSAALRNLR